MGFKRRARRYAATAATVSPARASSLDTTSHVRQFAGSSSAASEHPPRGGDVASCSRTRADCSSGVAPAPRPHERLARVRAPPGSCRRARRAALLDGARTRQHHGERRRRRPTRRQRGAGARRGLASSGSREPRTPQLRAASPRRNRRQFPHPVDGAENANAANAGEGGGQGQPGVGVRALDGPRTGVSSAANSSEGKRRARRHPSRRPSPGRASVRRAPCRPIGVSRSHVNSYVPAPVPSTG